MLRVLAEGGIWGAVPLTFTLLDTFTLLKALVLSIHCLAKVQITSGTGQVTAPALHDLCFLQLQEK